MAMRLTHTTIWVLDQDEALGFYTRKLGFEVNTDARLDHFRWLTVSPPGQPDHELILLEPGPPMMDDETAAQVRALVAKGVLGPGAFEVDDCARAFAELSDRDVTFLSEPTQRPYGLEATLRDQLRQLVQHDRTRAGAAAQRRIGAVTMSSRALRGH